MRKFNVVVNGEAFEVEIQEVGGSAPSAAPAAAPVRQEAPAAPAAAAPKQEEPAPAPKVKKSGGGSGTPIVAPLPGTLLEIKVKEGQKVKYADTVVVIEAMKMQNDIPAGMEGVVTSIEVSKGDSLQAGDVILYIA